VSRYSNFYKLQQFLQTLTYENATSIPDYWVENPCTVTNFTNAEASTFAEWGWRKGMKWT